MRYSRAVKFLEKNAPLFECEVCHKQKPPSAFHGWTVRSGMIMCRSCRREIKERRDKYAVERAALRAAMPLLYCLRCGNIWKPMPDTPPEGWRCGNHKCRSSDWTVLR